MHESQESGPADKSDTKIIVTSPAKTDLYLGDQVVTTGRLVDAEGNGIPNQTIVIKSIAHVLGFTRVNPVETATTDSTGAFTNTTLVEAKGAPPIIKTVKAEGWIEYAGTDSYKPTSTPHHKVTVHLTSPPTS